MVEKGKLKRKNILNKSIKNPTETSSFPDSFHHLVFDNSADLLAIINTSYYFTYSSSASELILGYSPFRMLEINILDITAGKDIPPLLHAISTLLGKPGEKRIVNISLFDFNDQLVNTEIILKSFKSEDTDYIFLNIRQLENLPERSPTLLNNEDFYEGLLEHLPFVVMRYNRNLKHIYVSPNVNQVLPFEPEELIRTHFDDLGYDKEMIDFLKESVSSVFQEGKSIEREFEHNSIKGTSVLNWLLIPEFDKDKSIESVLGILKDVTKEWKVSQQLLKSRNMSATAEKLTNSGTFTYNSKTGLVTWSEGIYLITGRQKSEGPIYFDEFENFCSTKNKDEFQKTFRKVIDTGKPGNCEIAMSNSDTSVILQVEIYPDPFFNSLNPEYIGIVKNITDLRNIEKDLSISDEKFKLIFQTIPDAIVYSSFDDGTLWDVNQGFLDLTGYSYDEVIMKSSVDIGLFGKKQDRDEFVKENRKGIVRKKELTFYNKKGEAIDVIISSAIQIVGNKEMLISTFRDISEEKKAKQELLTLYEILKESQHKLSSFAQNSPDGICIVDETGNIIEWNRSLVDFTGINRKKAIGSSFKEIQEILRQYNVGQALPAEKMTKLIDDFFEKGKVSRILGRTQIDLLSPGKSLIHLENIMFPVLTEKGKGIGLLSRDITEMVNDKQKISLYKDIFDNNDDGIGILDLELRLIEFNDSLIRILECEEEQIDKQTPAYFLSEKVFNEICKVYQYQGSFEGELIAFMSSGADKYLDYSMFPVYSGKLIVCHAVIISDISKRKQAEKELMKAKLQAEESDHLKTAFLSNMSHEIRTPMNSILGFSSLLEKPDLTEEKRLRYINYINRNGESLLNLIDDIIDISKIESNQLKINKSECNLQELFDELLATMNKIIVRSGKENLQLVRKIPNDFIYINTDIQRLRQILVNLIHNAIKFTEEGFVEFGYQINKKNEILFHVKDTGIGIPSQLQGSIFERFRKLENAKMKLYGGAGLGLAISRQLIDLLGGEIWFESYPNKGTIFYFTLPDSESNKGLISTYSSGSKPGHLKRPGRKILLVEDDLFCYELLCEYLADTEIEYIHAKSGKEAVKLFSENDDIDLIFMDIRLPEMNGYEATRLIKQINPNIPVIAQTAYAMQDEQAMALKSGCDDFITKPLGRETFYKIIESYLQ